MKIRTEFGMTRSVCTCAVCRNCCRYMPGYLVPADLERLTPAGLTWTERLDWAAIHLRASEGAKLRAVDGNEYQCPTLVPAHKEDLSCHWLGEDDCCEVHADAPFGCAFFSHADSLERDPLNGLPGLVAVLNAWQDMTGSGLHYTMTWVYLHAQNLLAPPLKVRKQAARSAEHRLVGIMLGKEIP